MTRSILAFAALLLSTTAFAAEDLGGGRQDNAGPARRDQARAAQVDSDIDRYGWAVAGQLLNARQKARANAGGGKGADRRSPDYRDPGDH